MSEFMVLILADEAEEARLSPSATRTQVDGHAAWEAALREAAAWLDGERLRPSAAGRRVSVRDGTPHVEVGPFGEATLAGYTLVQAENLDAALALTEGCPISAGTTIEVRPVLKGRSHPGKASLPGRVFAFAVLGQGVTEQAWIDVMDRIDTSATPVLGDDRFLGGVRLQPPGLGRQVRDVGGRRAVFDGPFLESKEVIGGLFFMRMSTLEEAVQWASKTEYVIHGVLEIRELWRS